MKLIDKAAVVAELEDWRDKIKKGIFSIPLSGSDRAYATFEYEVLGKVIISLDALEVKESLTWEDIRKLYIIFAEVDVDIEFFKITNIKPETIGYYQEVLKRFKAQKILQNKMSKNNKL